jgi:dihydrofolate reductase
LSEQPHHTITKQGGTSYIFITNGIESALKQAREAAGSQDIIVMGGADTVQQYLNAGLLDEIYLHIAHILLGGGTKLFDKLTITLTNLEKTAVVDAPGVTHLKFRVVK